MATTICSFLWEDCGSVDPFFIVVSFPVGLECDRHTVVHESKELCKF